MDQIIIERQEFGQILKRCKGDCWLLNEQCELLRGEIARLNGNLYMQ